MTFLEGFDQKLTQLGKLAVEKTKGMAQTAVVSREIQEEEDKIKQGYQKIGEQVFEKIDPQNIPQEYQALYSMIQASKKIIKEIEAEQVLEAHAALCPSCQSQIPMGSVFCNYCGAKIVREQYPDQGTDAAAKKADKLRCPACGKEHSNDQCFCIYCGHKLAVPGEPL